MVFIDLLSPKRNLPSAEEDLATAEAAPPGDSEDGEAGKALGCGTNGVA